MCIFIYLYIYISPPCCPPLCPFRHILLLPTRPGAEPCCAIGSQGGGVLRDEGLRQVHRGVHQGHRARARAVRGLQACGARHDPQGGGRTCMLSAQLGPGAVYAASQFGFGGSHVTGDCVAQGNALAAKGELEAAISIYKDALLEHRCAKRLSADGRPGCGQCKGKGGRVDVRGLLYTCMTLLGAYPAVSTPQTKNRPSCPRSTLHKTMNVE